jgi:protein-tyrosine-phosphatase/peptidoglycan/xylan/chitin deacetylase (PgdA/CDA1 family)
MEIKTLFIKTLGKAIVMPVVKRIYAGGMDHIITVFMLHRMEDKEAGISGHSPEFIRTLLKQLKEEGYNFISLDDAHRMYTGQLRFIKKSIVFTMDDGYRDQATIAAPIFREFDCPATIFLITGFLDHKMWPWDAKVRYIFSKTKKDELHLKINNQSFHFVIKNDDQSMEAMRTFRRQLKSQHADIILKALDELSSAAEIAIPEMPPREYSPMSWEQARQLERIGISFGAHTVNHFILSHLSEDRVKSELLGAWNRLNAELKNPSRLFAYPNGTVSDYGYKEIKQLQECGYDGAVTTTQGYLDIGNPVKYAHQEFEIKRMPLPYNLNDSVQYYTGFYKVKESLYSYKPGNLIERRYAGKRQFLKHYYYKFLYRFFDKSLESIDWDAVTRLVFICKGNICRSPYAEAYAKKIGVTAISAGLDTTRGKSANQSAIRVAFHRNIDMHAHIVKESDDISFQNGDLLVCMEPEHVHMLKHNELEDSIQTTLLGIWGDKFHPYIADPYGRSDEYYNYCFSVIESCVDGILGRLSQAICSKAI